MRYLSRIFWTNSWYVDCFVSLSVWLWMRYIFEFLWTHSCDVGTLVPNNFEFLTWNSNICISFIKLVTSWHYCLSYGSPSETSGLACWEPGQSITYAYVLQINSKVPFHSCPAPNLAQTPAELCQMSSCSGEHYNPSSYYPTLLLPYPTTTRAIAIYSSGQQKQHQRSTAVPGFPLYHSVNQ